MMIGSLIVQRPNGITIGFEGVSERVLSGAERVAEEMRREVPKGRTSNGENAGFNLSGFVGNMTSVNQRVNPPPNEYVEGSNRPTKRFSWDGSRSRKKNRGKFTPYNKDNGILESLFKSLRELLAIKKVVKAFNPHTRMTGKRKNKDITKYCHFCKDHGHNTNYYRELKSQIEEAVKSRQLAHLVKGIKKGKNKASDTQMSE
uniref:Reverse transcriptase domain-containing protein n=1 Tax=Tanacetum cinerariifolium TaxID=118510 RepID=A0A6L2LMR2_TANCI|nr:hypothetical protein [Tanacetum cinerariifolium]